MTEISIRAEEILRLGSFPVTNALLLSLLSFAVLAGFALLLNRRLALVPGRFQNTFEYALEGLLGLATSILQSREKAERYLPLFGTIFLFILISNWLGLLPGVGSFGLTHELGGEEVFVPLLRAPAADLNFTLALAVVAVLSINILGIVAIGFAKHFSKFFTVRSPIDFVVGILEFISELAKMISFSFRLFGNVFAGEVLLTIIAFLVPYVIPLPFLLLEVFVGFIQAFVFMMLTLVFISIATADELKVAH
ncbi:MAG: F0F1 ATP synthase subunit A [bacterium]|nr:F0F1 ATP synthase subunit A [bacterium]